MDDREALLDVLHRSQLEGFLGPGDSSNHLAHALGFVDAARALMPAPPERFLDLGTGGGVPGLVLALEWDKVAGVFLESSARRCRALEAWTEELRLDDRIRVIEGRAEDLAHDPGLREQFDVVTARSFGRPAVTAEIACGFLMVGGVLVVSEPPDPGPERWPAAGLADLGFEPIVQIVVRGVHYAGTRKVRAASVDIPRAVGRPAKRPLW